MTKTEEKLKHLQTLMDVTQDGIHVINTQGNIVEVNDAFCEILGYTRKEAMLLNISDWNSQYSKQELLARLQSFIGKNARFETVHRRKDGKLINVEVSISGVDIEGQLYFFASSRDITERKAAENKVRRLTQIYAALSQCNQAIVRCTNEVELFSTICRDVVSFGGMKMAWIGVIDETRNLVKPVASFGAGIEYLNGAEISIVAHNPGGMGPTGTAIRESKPIWCQDFQHDPATAAWHERGAEFDWCASASLPLYRKGVAIGAFTLYDDEANAFDEAAQNLLVKMAMDISFALDNYDREYERKLTGEENARLAERLDVATRAAKIGIWDWDVVNNNLIWDDRMFKLYGANREEFGGAYEAWRALVHPEDSVEANETMQRALRGEIPFDTEFRVSWHNGEIRNIKALGQVVRDVEGVPIRMTGVNYDITEHKQSEANLRIAAAAFESHESMMITDADRIILRVNKSFTENTGYTSEEVVGQTPRLLSSGHHKAGFYRAMWETINRTGAWQGEIWDRKKNGEVYPKWLTITAVKGEDGIVSHYVGSHIDITERKAAEEKIRYLGLYDDLTNLPNRRLLLDRLQHALASSARIGREGALLLIDLDNFKSLNDSLGHHVGDLLLQQIAQRLTSCVREGDTVARLGGDEFVVLLENLSEQTIEATAQTEAIGEKLLGCLSQPPYLLETHQYHATASIGATLFNGAAQFNDQDQVINELLKQADIAMYQAKKAGRNTLRYFNRQMQASITARVALEGELRKALENQQFKLYYQIQVDSTHHPIGAEVLIRWIHPVLGMVSPAQFIPMAEETGLILPIGFWVLDMACAQLKAWQQDALTRDLVLAVNVSARQFHQADFVAQVHDVVQRHAINPMRLKLELTEGMLLADVEETIKIMNVLSEIGIQFSLDDFGTGYSSLQYLKRLPLDQLKIDQSFVRNLVTDNSDKAIVRTIIAMAQSLGITVIAEGVETEEQRQLLLKDCCTHYQGFLFSKPVPITQFEALLKHG